MALVKPVEWWSGWADILGVIAIVLGGLWVLVMLVGWAFSWKAGKLKDAELTRYQVEARQSVAEANRAASIASQQATAANLELASLHSKMAPRRLTQEQQERLASGVKPLAQQLASVWYGAGDKESENFSWDIASALNAAGWRVFSPASSATLAQSGKPFGTIPRLQTGVVVSSNSDQTSVNAVDALVRELSALGFDVRKASATGDRAEPVVVVTVQARPDGPQGDQKLKAVGR